MTNSDTTDTTATVLTDGGTKPIRGSREVRASGDAIREYSADGNLYAYREGDEHVVVAQGHNPQSQWTKRVPAERDTVSTGQHLWTIPDNWDHRVKINGRAATRYAIYHIPEADVDVLVNVPNETRLRDAWYNIKRVGTLSVTYNDEIDWDELEATIESARERKEVTDDVVEALENIYHHQQQFEQTIAEEVNFYAMDAVFDHSFGQEPISFNGWTIDPWRDSFDISHLVQKFLDVDNETLDAVVHELSNAIPSYPAVRVDVDADEGDS